MPAFTIGQNQALDDHLNWCKHIIEENEKSIAMFRSGEMKIGRNGQDMTSEWVSELERQTEVLRRLVKNFEPAKFQGQVKS